MLGRARKPRPPEDAAVGPVEELLRAATARHPSAASTIDGRPQAARALWICACVSMYDAPTWLIYEDLTGGIAWRRVPSACRLSELVDARLLVGGHADPDAVLRWLTGEESDPFGDGGDGQDNHEVLEAFAVKLTVR